MAPFFQRRKYRDLSLPPQWSSSQGPIASVATARSLFQWMGIANIRDARRFLETHQELLDPTSEMIIGFSIRQAEGSTKVDYERLDILREIKARGNNIAAIREAYVDIYNGLRALDVPSWIETFQNQSLAVEDTPEQKVLVLIPLLRDAIAHAKRDSGVAPEVLATLKHWLGSELSELPEANFSEVIMLWEEAVKIYTLQRYPRQYAALQKDLGNTYSASSADLHQQEQQKRLSQAVGCLENALQVYTHGEFPEEWLQTQIMLGFTYMNMGEKKRAQQCLEAALAKINPAQHSQLWGYLQDALRELNEEYSSLSFINEAEKAGLITTENAKELRKKHR